MDMLAKVDFCKATSSQESRQTVVAEPLAETINHGLLLP
jgi:hypothetical protein